MTDPSFAVPRLMTALDDSVEREPEAAEPATTRAATEQDAMAAMVKGGGWVRGNRAALPASPRSTGIKMRAQVARWRVARRHLNPTAPQPSGQPALSVYVEFRVYRIWD